MVIKLITIICSLIIIVGNQKGTIPVIHNELPTPNQQTTVMEKKANENIFMSDTETTSKVSLNNSINKKETNLSKQIDQQGKQKNKINVLNDSKVVNKQESIQKIENTNNIEITNKNESIPKEEKIDINENNDETVNNSEVKNLAPIFYDRTTSIYDNDNKTLLRIEYYVNNKLTYYSYIEQFDVTTRSYIEKICKWNYEKNKEVLVRTDVYSNGKLTKSY